MGGEWASQDFTRPGGFGPGSWVKPLQVVVVCWSRFGALSSSVGLGGEGARGIWFQRGRGVVVGEMTGLLDALGTPRSPGNGRLWPG